ncbi:SHOCT domain-containing protein [Faecalibaculum rodentium]|uniref:SHOCT domain-containing protein n=1 Tax=Faecalibaculum rodentium TaxID=1702221 RepID=UPI00272CE850|nr:SHOCT domain-containing protein [Faecalibaculum rodentium]
MTDFERRFRYHALCYMTDDLLGQGLITLSEYHRILQKLSQDYLGGSVPPGKEENVINKM